MISMDHKLQSICTFSSQTVNSFKKLLAPQPAIGSCFIPLLDSSTGLGQVSLGQPYKILYIKRHFLRVQVNPILTLELCHFQSDTILTINMPYNSTQLHPLFCNLAMDLQVRPVQIKLINKDLNFWSIFVHLKQVYKYGPQIVVHSCALETSL